MIDALLGMASGMVIMACGMLLGYDIALKRLRQIRRQEEEELAEATRTHQFIGRLVSPNLEQDISIPSEQGPRHGV